MADEYFLVFWDQRGTGLSPREHKDVLTLAMYVTDLNTLLDRYSAGRPAFFRGLNLGADLTGSAGVYPPRLVRRGTIRKG
ncbi:MAG: hypothetical protein ACRENP_10235 [Longimicrobiales bacterium]